MKGEAICARAWRAAVMAVAPTVAPIAVAAIEPCRNPRREKRAATISPMVRFKVGLSPGPSASSRRLVGKRLVVTSSFMALAPCWLGRAPRRRPRCAAPPDGDAKVTV